MTKTILVAGTASHVGKSTVTAGLCRLLTRRGESVAPFKGQNMSTNAEVALTPSGDWGEIGVSQFVQARAARIVPTSDMNPVLLKPSGDGESQLVIQGETVGHVEAGGYHDHWERARRAAIDSYQRLAETHDVIVAEGAGSIAEINLHDRDLANVETAEFADATIVILVDIERGGAFASLYGTLELLPDHIRDRVAGAIITKFRGDRSLLSTGIDEIESRTGVPILGVLPHEDPGLPAEDSVSLPAPGERTVVGDDDSIPPERAVTVAVPRLPHMANFTDLEPLVKEPGVRVAYVPLEGSIADSDAVIVPGSKNTVDDLRALRAAGLHEELRAFDGPIVGMCGGYQLLGERITNAAIEGTGDINTVQGVGLLPVETEFAREKQVQRVTRDLNGGGPLAGGSGTVTGYEIHMGRTEADGSSDEPIGPESAASGQVLGTYLHGLFENENARTAFLGTVFETAGSGPLPTREHTDSRSPADRAAALLEEYVSLKPLGL